MNKAKVWIPEIIDYARLKAAQSRYILCDDAQMLKACGDDPNPDPDYDALAEPSLTERWGEQKAEWQAAMRRTERYWREQTRQAFERSEAARSPRSTMLRERRH